MLIFILFVVAANVAEILGVVMMAPQRTDKTQSAEVNETVLPNPYNISSPITGIAKYKFYDKRSIIEWTNVWKYRSENVTVVAVQGQEDLMENSFVIDENIDNLGVSIYGVFDGYLTNIIVDYLAYVMMDNFKTKVIAIKKGARHENLTQYICSDGSVNYTGLLHHEIMMAEKYLFEKSNETDDWMAKWQYAKCGSSVLIAVIDGHQLHIAHVGDSNALMYTTEGKVTNLTEPHTIYYNLNERSRVEKTGAHPIEWRGRNDKSRVVGDFCYKEISPFLIPDPDLFTYDLSERHSEFVVLATDWIRHCTGDFPDEQKDRMIVELVERHLRTNLTEAMLDLLLRSPQQTIVGHSRTIMVIKTGKT